MEKKVFISASTFAEYGRKPLDLLDEAEFSYSINPLGRRLVHDEVVKMGQGCEGVIAGLEPYDEYVIDNLPSLKCISRCGVGLDNVALEKAGQKGIKVFNTPDVVTQPVAELTIAMIFDVLRGLSFYTAALRAGKWKKQAGNLLGGVKIGILGAGRIGKRVAEILSGLGAQVYCCDVRPDNKWAEEKRIEFVAVDELLIYCDILSIHLSDNTDNSFKLDEEKIAAMKKGAAIINTSRGKFIDEEALYKALKNSHLSAAALDVFSKEPYSGNLCKLDNVILTPHIATLTRQSRLQMEVEAAENLIGYLTDKKI
ncbi:MAG: phosphoglycerate dehydrogenase [Candidatus Omnitrophota bacterium]|jgi:D-3-phosphoglycerate dehydrogenase